MKFMAANYTPRRDLKFREPEWEEADGRSRRQEAEGERGGSNPESVDPRPPQRAGPLVFGVRRPGAASVGGGLTPHLATNPLNAQKLRQVPSDQSAARPAQSKE